jgi:hypothetical protein
MMRIVLVGFLPSDHGRNCKKHPYGCGNALIEEEGDGTGRLIHLHLVEKTYLVGYEVKDDGTDGCHIFPPLVTMQLGILQQNSTAWF